MCLFGAAHGCRGVEGLGAKRTPALKPVTQHPTKMKLGTIIPYLNPLTFLSL